MRLRLVPPVDALTLAASSLDLGTLSPLEDLPASLQTAALAASGWSTFVRADHPLPSTPTLAEWCDEDHVLISAPEFHAGPIQRTLRELGVHRREVLYVQDFLSGLHVAATSNLLLSAPLLPLVDAAAALGMRRVPLPFDLPPMVGRLAWHRRLDNDPAHRWIRRFLSGE